MAKGKGFRGDSRNGERKKKYGGKIKKDRKGIERSRTEGVWEECEYIIKCPKSKGKGESEGRMKGWAVTRGRKLAKKDFLRQATLIIREVENVQENNLLTKRRPV